jgi:hypothetical protein
MSEEQFWHYIVNEEKQGPVSVEQLHGLVASGTITPETLVWTDSLEDWTSASNLEGLFSDKDAVPQSPALITGAAAQASNPLASAPVPQPVTAQGPGFSLGGTLAGGPQFGSGAIPPGAEQRLQLRSIGVLHMGAVMMCLSVSTLIAYYIFAVTVLAYLSSRLGVGGVLGTVAPEGIIVVIFSLVLTAGFGFIGGVFTAWVYNLSAKMFGGLILKIKAIPNW